MAAAVVDPRSVVGTTTSGGAVALWADAPRRTATVRQVRGDARRPRRFGGVPVRGKAEAAAARDGRAAPAATRAKGAVFQLGVAAVGCPVGSAVVATAADGDAAVVSAHTTRRPPPCLGPSPHRPCAGRGTHAAHWLADGRLRRCADAGARAVVWRGSPASAPPRGGGDGDPAVGRGGARSRRGRRAALATRGGHCGRRRGRGARRARVATAAAAAAREGGPPDRRCACRQRRHRGWRLQRYYPVSGSGRGSGRRHYCDCHRGRLHGRHRRGYHGGPFARLLAPRRTGSPTAAAATGWGCRDVAARERARRAGHGPLRCPVAVRSCWLAARAR